MSKLLEDWNAKSLAPTPGAPGGITHVAISITQDDGRTTGSELDFPAVASGFEEDCEASHADHGGHASAHAGHADHDAGGSSGSFDLLDPFGPLTPSFVVIQPLYCPMFEPAAWSHEFWDQTTASTLACGNGQNHGDAASDVAAIHALGSAGTDGWI